MATFSQRIQGAVTFEDQVQRFLEHRRDILCVARSGSEITYPDVAALLRHRSDDTSLFLRHAPDGVAIPVQNEPFFWEAKCSTCIEREAYETYRRYQNAGCRVLVFLRGEDAVFT